MDQDTILTNNYRWWINEQLDEDHYVFKSGYTKRDIISENPKYKIPKLINLNKYMITLQSQENCYDNKIELLNTEYANCWIGYDYNFQVNNDEKIYMNEYCQIPYIEGIIPNKYISSCIDIKDFNVFIWNSNNKYSNSDSDYHRLTYCKLLNPIYNKDKTEKITHFYTTNFNFPLITSFEGWHQLKKIYNVEKYSNIFVVGKNSTYDINLMFDKLISVFKKTDLSENK